MNHNKKINLANKFDGKHKSEGKKTMQGCKASSICQESLKPTRHSVSSSSEMHNVVQKA